MEIYPEVERLVQILPAGTTISLHADSFNAEVNRPAYQQWLSSFCELLMTYGSGSIEVGFGSSRRWIAALQLVVGADVSVSFRGG